jgi:hypothetical protein
MTAAKLVQRRQVERVCVSLAEIFAKHSGKTPASVLRTVPKIPRPPPHTKARVVWGALLVAWNTGELLDRRDQLKAAKRRGRKGSTSEESRRDQAAARLEKAAKQMRKAAALRKLDAEEALSEKRGRYGPRVREARDKRAREARDEARKIEKAACVVDKLAESMTGIPGLPVIRTQAQWHRFLSRAATSLLEVGYTNREVVAMLTDQAPEDVDRATLERFRQRVRRLPITAALLVLYGHP